MTLLTLNGTTYIAEPGTIMRTRMGFVRQDRLIFVEMGIRLEHGGFLSTADYVMGGRHEGAARTEGAAFDVDYMMHVTAAANVLNWEDLKGSSLRVLFKAESTDRQRACGLARLDGTHAVVFADLAKSGKGRGL